jgi:hypothetical protein
MTLDPDRVQAIFLAALEQETLADRSAVLDRECANDDELRRRVEALLIAHDKPDSPLDRPFIVPDEPIWAILEQATGSAAEVEPHPGPEERKP